MASYPRDVLFLGNVDEHRGNWGFHEMYTQLSLASPLANATLRLRRRGSANVCKRRAYIAPLSFIYRLSMFRLHMSFPPKQPWKLVGAFRNI
jgi:hypothetical protein